MKSILATLISVFTSVFAFAQKEKQTYKTVAHAFETNYNMDRFDTVFSAFSTEMQGALPSHKTREFLTGLKQQVGNILRREFVRYDRSYAVYKTFFEKAVLAINLSIDNSSKINGLSITPYKEVNFPKPERNVTKLVLPFKDEWTVIWGGDTKELNYHVESEAQKNAFDLVITDTAGKSFRTDGKKNEDYYAFGKELFAPCDGEVVLVVEGVKDNLPGTLNPMYIPGNTVVIKTANNEYLFFAHFRQHSIMVKQGQRVKQGQTLGQCGNSGNSSEPHLHFHIQNLEDINISTGIKCYFDRIMVNGKAIVDYSPIKKDRVKNR